MSRFDEEPDGDPHGECVLEIASLQSENARLREEVEMLNVRHAAVMLHAQTHADEYNALREDVNGLLQDIQRLTEEAFKRDEELSLANGTIESRDRNIATLQEELAEAKRELFIQTRELFIQTQAAAHLGRLVAEKDADRVFFRDKAEQAEKDLRRMQSIFDAVVAIQGDEEVLKYVNSLNGIPITRCTVSADLIRQLVDSRKQAEARALANEKDAGRYRFLRHNAGFTIRCSLFGDVGMREHKESDLDELIDSAITGDKHVG